LRALALPVPVLRQFGQFDHQITGCFRIKEHDLAITVPDHRFLPLEADTLGGVFSRVAARTTNAPTFKTIGSRPKFDDEAAVGFFYETTGRWLM
jgi:hypothetical protein